MGVAIHARGRDIAKRAHYCRVDALLVDSSRCFQILDRHLDFVVQEPVSVLTDDFEGCRNDVYSSIDQVGHEEIALLADRGDG